MVRPTHQQLPVRSLAHLRRELVRQAQLFDDPQAYAAGVLDAFDALVADRQAEPRPDPAQPPDRSRPPGVVDT